MKCYRQRLGVWSVLLLLSILPSLALAKSQEEEIANGRKAVTELREIGFTTEKPLTEVGNALKEQVTRKDLPWQFWVLEDEGELNAVALPGGFVFITRLYYERLTADELAFVIGHEMSHIDLRHHEQSRKRAKQARLFNVLAGIILGVTKAGRGWGTAADLGATAYYTKYSRKLEKQADLGGFTMARNAGFDAHGAVSALSKLGKGPDDPIYRNIFATHPVLSSREDRLEVLAQENTNPIPRLVVQKPANPDWKPQKISQNELKARPAVAVRIVDGTGIRWDSNWRGDLRKYISRSVVQSGTFAVKGEGRADEKDMPKLDELLKKDDVDWLLIITVQQMQADVVGPAGETGRDVSAIIDVSPKLMNTTTGEEIPLPKVHQTLEGRDFLPLDNEDLYPDMTLTHAVTKASDTLAVHINTALKTWLNGSPTQPSENKKKSDTVKGFDPNSKTIGNTGSSPAGAQASHP